MRFEKLKLADFQAHEELAIVLSPTITTIVGPSDSGKSAILRALRWACLNDLAGDEFIREGAKNTSVTLNVEGDHVIVRAKGSGPGNSYELDGKEYHAFGQSVPSDIAQLLAINEINFQGQHDSPFWFNETAGEVSRRLNAVVDLSVIDEVITNIAALVRQGQERKKISSERLKELTEEFDALKGQAKRITQFETLKEHHEVLDKADEDHSRLAGLVERIRATRNQVQIHEQKQSSIQIVVVTAGEALEYFTQCEQLSLLIRRIKENEATSTPPPKFKPVEDTFKYWRDCDGGCQSLQDQIKQIERQKRTADEALADFGVAEQKFHQAIKGKRCPICGNPL